MAQFRSNQPEGFQQRLYDLWLKSGLTQKQLADKVGRERKAIIMYLHGDVAPDILVLSKLCVALHTTADYLIFGKVNKKGSGADENRRY